MLFMGYTKDPSMRNGENKGDHQCHNIFFFFQKRESFLKEQLCFSQQQSQAY